MSKKRIVVAMSGGVDSSACAALLARDGHEVIGITLRLWTPSAWNDGEKFGGCCSPRDLADAKEVCRKLGIPHYTYNLEEKFKETVVDNFVSEYLSGRTPNPCVRCNAFVKFDVLLRYAVALNADYLATGHYARIVREIPEGPSSLRKAKDPGKDQSYFLYMLGQKELSRVLFPLGDMRKEEVRQTALSFGLPNAQKPDSQDVCFLEGRNYREFVKERVGGEAPQPGLIKTADGRVLGEHQGLPYYTIGQREGLGIAAGFRMYVLKKESGSNTLVVGPAGENEALSCSLDSVNWCSGEVPGNIRASVKPRYRHPGALAAIEAVAGGRASIEFDTPQASLAEGQSAVFYEGDAVLGGGIISKVGRHARERPPSYNIQGSGTSSLKPGRGHPVIDSRLRGNDER